MMNWTRVYKVMGWYNISLFIMILLLVGKEYPLIGRYAAIQGASFVFGLLMYFTYWLWSDIDG